MTRTEKQIIKEIEGYLGALPKSLTDMINAREYDRFLISLKQHNYQMLSEVDGENITDDEYAEVQGLISKLSNIVYDTV